MVKFLAPLALATAALATPAVYDPKWTAYKQKFNKDYTVEEDTTRYNIYLQTMTEISEHNARADAGLESFWQGETTHTDMTHDEVNKKNGWGKHYKKKGAKNPALGVEQYPCPQWTQGSQATPVDVDWISEGVVTMVKNQMYCGDCWAFSSAACMESSWAIATGQLISMSAQQLTDCTSEPSMGFYETDGCNGGFPQNAFAYEVGAGGIEPWTAYPFADMQTECAYNSALSVASFDSCYDVTEGDEAVLAAGIAQLGPVSVAIDAGLSSFHNYVSGVYYAASCSTTELDHAVIATGYGVVPEINSAISATCTEEDFMCEVLAEDTKFMYPCINKPTGDANKAWKVTQNVPGVDCNAPSQWAGEEFYMVKNSWGIDWGMQGYIMMARNQDNNCGIATAPSFITANPQ